MIFSYIRRLRPFFLFKLLNFNIFWGSQLVNIFWGMKILWIFFWSHQKIGLCLGIISMHFRVFPRSWYRMGDFFGGLLKFQIFFGMLEIPYIFGG